ncbi:MAG: type IV pilus twitching motility protein PilT [Pyrinomonadaceae bacterium]
METLNEYLQILVSSSSYELRLEPDKNPYLVSEKGTTDVSRFPMAGTQIGLMVFPLIPPDAKQELPNQPEVQFFHPHNLGRFNFVVQKSPAGFNVSIKPAPVAAPAKPVEQPKLAETSEFGDVYEFEFDSSATPEFEFESSSTAKEANGSAQTNSLYIPELDIAEEYMPSITLPQGGPAIEVVSANDPQFTTTFSDTSTYEPPAKRSDFQIDTGLAEPMTFIPTVSTDQPEPTIELPTADRRSTDRRKTNLMMTARMDALFHKMNEAGASDLHLSVSMAPMVRKDGKMAALESNESVLTPETMRELLTSIMPERNRNEFAERKDTDFAYEIHGLARFRCNVFMDRKGMGGVFRIIPTKILTAEQLGLSKAIMDLCQLSKGLVVVTGPTGSGKSTTLCAMVDSINKNREDHIITIEDPIEFVHDNQKCLVNQREVHNHTDSFKDALRAALREDPDIVLVGEMRDLETISIAIETAETGHLVFGTLHTTTAPSTVDRIIDQFPADRQQQIRVMLSESLKGVIAQTLVPKKGGGRVAALEVLIITPAVSNLIREGKTFQIPSAMQTGKTHGMVLLNDSLYDLVQKGVVEPKDAYIKAVDKTNFETMLTRGGFKL